MKYHGSNATASLTDNQLTNDAPWTFLSTFNRAPGCGNSVRMTEGGPDAAVADAVKFQKQ